MKNLGLCVGLFVVGCVPPDDVGAAPAAAVEIIGCSAGQGQKLESALHELVGGPTAETAECMNDAMFVDQADRSVESTLAAMVPPEDLTLRCGSCPGGEQACATGDAEVTVTHGAVNLLNDVELAGALAYGLERLAGFEVSSGVGHSVPEVAERCIVEGSPPGWGRSQLGGPVALPRVGEGGGVQLQDILQSCIGVVDPIDSTHSFAPIGVGLLGSVDAYGVRRVSRILCGVENGDTWVPITQTPPDPPPGATQFSIRCPPSEALVGITGEAGEGVDRLQLVCASLADLRAPGDDVGTLGDSVGVVGDPSDAYVRECPTGKVVQQIRVRETDRLGTLEVVCDDYHQLDRRDRGGATGYSHPGTLGGELRQIHCPGETRLTGLFGAYDSSFRLRRIGGTCGQVIGDRLSASANLSDADNRIGPVGGDLEPTDTLFEAVCPSGQVVRGIQSMDHASGAVGAFTPLCGAPTSFPDFGPGPPAAEPLFELDAVDTEHWCDGSAPRALSVRTTGGVVGEFELSECSLFPPAVVPLERYSHTASNDGADFGERCSGSGALTGLQLRHDGSSLLAIGTVCGTAVGHRAWTQEGYVSPHLYGGDAGAQLTRRCPEGSVLAGVEGESGEHIDGVSLICRPAATVHTDGSGETVVVGFESVAGGTPFVLTCPPGEVVHGIRGRAAERLSTLAIECGAGDLVPGDTVTGTLAGSSRHRYRLGIVADISFPEIMVERLSGSASVPFGLQMEMGSAIWRGEPDGAGGSRIAGGDSPMRHAVYWITVEGGRGVGDYALRVQARRRGGAGR